MRGITPLIIILAGIFLCFLMSYYIINKEHDKTTKVVLNSIQIIILIFLWKYSSYVYVKKLNVLPDDYYVYIPTLFVALVIGVINNLDRVKKILGIANRD